MKALWPRVRYRLAEVKDATKPVIDQVLEQVGSGSTPIMVTGLEHLAFPGSEELGMWQNLNITRPRWVRELPRTVVFWVTEDAHRLLATRAPDLYRFRSTSIDLRLPKSDADERVAELRQRIRTIKATPATRLRWFTELWRRTKERAALDGLLIEAMKGGGSLPENAKETLLSKTILVATNPEIIDLSPLRALTSLQELDCTGTQVPDLSPLSGLTSLQKLSCNNTQVSDLSALRALTSLQYLTFYGTQVTELSLLSGFTKLRVLNCSNTQVSDLSPLSGLTSLWAFSCSFTSVCDLSPLSELTNLKILFSSNTQISDLSPLKGLTNLKILFSSNTQISDLSPLSGLTSLHTLSCDGTQISDLSPLKGFTNLKSLSCEGTQVSDLSPLSSLTNLREFDCQKTKVTREEVEKLQDALPHCKIISDNE